MEDKPEATLSVDPGGLLSLQTPMGAELQISPDSRGLDFVTNRVILRGAIGETAGFELRLRGRRGIVRAVDMAVARLTMGDGVAMAAEFQRFRVHPVVVERWPGWHVRMVDAAERPSRIFDVVVPADAPTGGLPAALRQGEEMWLLAELTIPPGTPPGVYTSAVTIADGETILGEIPLQLTVLPFTLPDVLAVSVMSTVDVTRFGGQGGTIALAETVRVLRAHGVSPLLTRIYPITKLDRANDVRIDWAGFDRIVAPLMNIGRQQAGAPVWCRIPLDEHHQLERGDSRRHDPAVDQVITRYLRGCAEHFAERGWLDRSFVEVPRVEPLSDDTIDAIGNYAGLARRADRRLRTMTTAHAYDVPGRTWQYLTEAEVDGWIDTWAPPAQFCDPTVVPAAKTTWMIADRPPYSGTTEPTGNPTFARVLPLQARRYGVENVLVGDANDSPDSPDGLLYSGAPYGLPHSVASMRLKYLRSGMEDLAYLSLLDARGSENFATRMLDLLTPYALTEAYGHHVADVRGIGWVLDERLWDDARQVMIDQLLDPIGYAAGRTRGDLGKGVGWETLLGATGRVDVSMQGVRVRPTTQPGTVRVTCWLTIENRTHLPVSGHIAFVDLPIGWHEVGSAREIEPIPPYGRSQTLLEAETTNLAWDANGTAPLDIVFRGSDGKVHKTTARVCHIAALRPEGRVVIDGDLSDWPISAGNVAADFVPIAGRSGTALKEALVTRCLVMCDDRYVYFGIACSTDRSVATTGGQSNIVNYEDMIPVGEDLVEILIDPTNAGTHAAEDLLHIAIKRSGILFERGVATEPMIGQRTIWAADVRYAARSSPGRWTIEVRVPLKAVTDARDATRIWGINFTRYDSKRQVYETWAGAKYNAYDPMSLGNLSLP